LIKTIKLIIKKLINCLKLKNLIVLNCNKKNKKNKKIKFLLIIN